MDAKLDFFFFQQNDSQKILHKKMFLLHIPLILRQRFCLIMKKCLLILVLVVLGGVCFGQKAFISDISITGNNITASSIIIRELPFSKGEIIDTSILPALLTEAQQNLLNTSLFNYVTIRQLPAEIAADTPIEANAVSIAIEVEERWYIWPIIELRLEDRNMTSWIKKMNWERVTLHTGLKINNIFGLAHKLEIRGLIGWEKGIDISYSRIALDRNKKLYLSLESYAMYYKNVDFLTSNNKLQHLSADNYLKRSRGINASLTYRPQIRWRATAKLGYDVSKISTELFDANPHYWGVDTRKARTLTLETSLCHEDRDYILYPTQGKYAQLSLRTSESNNFNFNYLQIQLDLQYYKKLSERWLASSSIKLSASFDTRYSYLHSKAVGYGNANITGYELYVIDGQHYVTQNNSIKYLILPQRVVELGKNPKWRKFNKPHFTIYGKFLYDFGYVFQEKRWQGNNTYPNKFLYGMGVGIDLVTYYDIVANVGYAVNAKGKGSFLFGFRAPIF